MSQDIRIIRADYHHFSGLHAMWAADYAEEVGMTEEYDEAVFRYHVQEMLQSGQAALFVAYLSLTPIGWALAALQENVITGAIEAHQILWYVDKPYRRTTAGRDLEEAMVGWGRQQGASKIIMSYLGDSPRMERYLRSMGYVKRSTYFVKEM